MAQNKSILLINKETFLQIPELISSGEISFANTGIQEIISSYSIYTITGKINENEKIEDIKNIISQSKLAIIDENEQIIFEKKEYLILGLEKTIIILEKPSDSIHDVLLQIKKDLPIYFLKENNNSDNTFAEEIESMNIELRKIIQRKSKFYRLWSMIVPYISFYLFRSSYLKLPKDRFEHFLNDCKIGWEPKDIEEKEYIELVYLYAN